MGERFSKRFTMADVQRLRARNVGVKMALDSTIGPIIAGKNPIMGSPIEKRRGRMNKLETRREQYLKAQQYEGLIKDYAFELFKIRLATGAWYCWDFIIKMGNGNIIAEDVKGYMWSRDAVRIKVAAKELSRFGIALRVVKFEKGNWEEKYIPTD